MGTVRTCIWARHRRALNPQLQREEDSDLAWVRHPPRSERQAKYPYLFPVAAIYWSQAAAAVEYVKHKLGGNLKGKKIAYLLYDNPLARGCRCCRICKERRLRA